MTVIKNDLICYNGRMMQWSQAELNPNEALSCNFIYQKIHAFEHRPLHAKTHVELAVMSYTIMYGEEPELSVETLNKEVAMVLGENRYPMGSVVIMLYLFPPKEDQMPPTRIVACSQQLLYKRYTLWHTAMRAIVVPYEYPFTPHKTAVSLTAHNYAQHYARQKGADVALTENYAQMLISVGENPLFAIIKQKVFTTPIESGATDSVERRLGIAGCERAGWEVFDNPLESSRLKEYDELFYISPQGVVSIGSVLGQTYPNSAANHLFHQIENLYDGF